MTSNFKKMCALLFLLAVAGAGPSGCRSTTPTGEQPAGDVAQPVVLKNPVQAPLPERTAEELAREVMINAGSFRSLRADCTVTFRYPNLRGPEGERLDYLPLDGRIAVAYGRKFRLILESTQKTMVDVTGDGSQFLVELPGLGATRYSGGYDRPLPMEGGRITLMPDDLAEAFDQNRLFMNTVLALKSYPDWWEMEALRSFGGEPIVMATYRIKRERTSIDQKPAQINTYTKFDSSGYIRAIIVMREYRDLVDKRHGERGAVCAIPHDVTISYPRNGTELRIQLRDVEFNPRDLRPTVFDVGAKSGPGARRSIQPVR